jgi:hypothetical protein
MAIIKCPECGHQISEKATICPSCGVEIAGKVAKCAHCGEVFFKDDGFCPHCYTPFQTIGKERIAITDDEPEGENKPQATAEPNEPQPVINSENKTDAANTENGQDVTDASPIEEEAIEQNSFSSLEEDEQPTTIAEQPVEEKSEPRYAYESDTDSTASSNEEDVENTSRTNEQEKGKDEDLEKDEEDHEMVYIDTDGENLERPEHVEENDSQDSTGRYKYIPVVVSLAISALIAAVCFYFYNESKLTRETQAFNIAMKSGDVNEMNRFLRNYTDATNEHKEAIKKRMSSITQEEIDFMEAITFRDKNKLSQLLANYPQISQKQRILSMIDSLDWEEAVRTNTKEGYEKYLAEHTAGLFSKEAKDKVTVKMLAASAEDEAMAKSLFREFFLGVNANDEARTNATLHTQLSSFMGTENANSGTVSSWMHQQHKDDVSNVIWKLNHDYKITKKELNNHQEYLIDFTAKRTIVHKDGRSTSESFKINSSLTEGKKIASMNMTKYTPSSSETASKSSASSTSSNNSSKPSQQASSSKPSQKTNTSSKPQTAQNKSSNQSSGSSSSAQKPASKTTASSSAQASKPANKPASSNSAQASKPTNKSASSSSAQASKPTNKPASSSSAQASKPASKPASSSSAQASKPTNKPAASSSSQASKPANKTVASSSAPSQKTTASK